MGAWLATSGTVHGATLYDNSTVDTGNSLNFTNGWTMGNEIILGGGIPSALVTNFSFEIYSPQFAFAGGANVKMEAFLYANNGTPFNGYASPGTTLYDSGLFNLLTPQQYTIAYGLPLSDAVKLVFDLSAAPVAVGSDFTFGVVVTGLASTDTVGMELFNPAAFGLNHGDYWLNNGSGWALLTNSVPTDFGAKFAGTVTPEPSAFYLGAAGATLLTGLTWLRRRQDSSKHN